MQELFARSEQTLERARRVVQDSGVISCWAAVGARVELVGSMRTGLMLHHLDIDMHVYTSDCSIAESFGAMASLAGDSRIQRVEYVNLLEAEDHCLEWHAWYKDTQGAIWQLDMIHMSETSPFAGYFERVADAVRNALTPETRRAILEIRHAFRDDAEVKGIQVYQAVLRDGIRGPGEFQRWQDEHAVQGIIDWMP
ncbi:hypothetical protein SAMN02745704_00085 [Paucidesulfovibrio gracilis DSM 16080]|uniref:Nucleotidyltransferase domain-containing protein n=1 Tax=Paucidesulfovibrio gracilis DSM 16080 TaxID=1121449 RepID=A0A1T4W276_9BACT|nr:hypothetical protein [Paucidesulfovibrio gracilis]SKA71158.1 hypothetical protein SAMN02745704_00085 [Paucidesulfovibrio gracilis DSM 16080]